MGWIPKIEEAITDKTKAILVDRLTCEMIKKHKIDLYRNLEDIKQLSWLPKKKI